jgi:hypothetical protein
MRRDVALAAVVFVATLGILAGGWSILRRSSAGPASAIPSTAGSALVPVSSGPSASGAASVGSAGIAPDATQLVPSFAPRPSGQLPTIVLTGAGDIAACGSDGARATSDLLLGQEGWFFTAGDNAYEDGTPINFARCYAPTWGRVLDRTILPAAGNHDWQTKGAAGYHAYFGARAEPNGTTWYSMDLGGWHIVVLDSDCADVGGCDAASAEGRWLSQDLAASSAHCTLAIWHHPRFSSGEHGDDAEVGPFWQMLYQAHAELIVNGHDHDYERFAPMDPNGAETRPGGIREIVVGTGGASLRPFHTIAANSEFRLAGTYGVLRLTLHPANYDWEFLPAGGTVADAGSAPCH